MIFMLVYVIFLILDSDLEKIVFHKCSLSLKNPNLNLDSTNYGCGIHLVLQLIYGRFERIRFKGNVQWIIIRMKVCFKRIK